MVRIGPRRTGLEVSLAFPFSGPGFLMLFVMTAFFGVIRFTEWLLSEDAVAISSAAVVVFALFAAAYIARSLVVTAEAATEGADMAPGPPNILEAENLFGAFLGLIAAAGLSLVPFGLVKILHLDGAALYVAVGIGAFYLPMGILGVAVRGEINGCFPGYVVPGIFAAPLRYLPSVILTAMAGFLILAGRDGTLGDFPTILLLGVETVAGWLVYSAMHRAGVVHREEVALQAAIPEPEPVVIGEEALTPSRPMSDIERVMLDRQKEREGALPTDHLPKRKDPPGA